MHTLKGRCDRAKKLLDSGPGLAPDKFAVDCHCRMSLSIGTFSHGQNPFPFSRS